jgi:hypothetical protein
MSAAMRILAIQLDHLEIFRIAIQQRDFGAQTSIVTIEWIKLIANALFLDLLH